MSSANGIFPSYRKQTLVEAKIISPDLKASRVFQCQHVGYFRGKLILQTFTKVVSNFWGEGVVFVSFWFIPLLHTVKERLPVRCWTSPVDTQSFSVIKAVTHKKVPTHRHAPFARFSVRCSDETQHAILTGVPRVGGIEHFVILARSH